MGYWVAVVAETAEVALKTRLSSLGTRASPSAIPSLRSAPLIDIACGDSSLQSSGDISLRSAATPPFDLHSLLLALHLRGRQSVLSAVAKGRYGIDGAAACHRRITADDFDCRPAQMKSQWNANVESQAGR